MKSVDILGMFSDTLEFKLDGCGVTPLSFPYSEPWHSFPSGMISQTRGASGLMEFKGMPSFKRSSGDAVIVPAGSMISYRLCGEPETEILARWSLFHFRVLGFADALSFFELPALIVGDRAERLGDLNAALTELRADTARTKLETAVRIKKTGFALLETIFELVPLKSTSTARWDVLTRIGPSLELIEKGFKERITVKELALKAGMSETRFHASFKLATGTSPLDYLIGRRTREAQRLLCSTDLGVAEIAEMCGYDDPFFFSRIFKARCGASPRAYRGMAAEVFCGCGIITSPVI